MKPYPDAVERFWFGEHVKDEHAFYEMIKYLADRLEYERSTEKKPKQRRNRKTS